MEYNVCSKLIVEIVQHYQYLCKYFFVVLFEQTIPANIYLFKVNCKELSSAISSKLILKTPERLLVSLLIILNIFFTSVSIVNFEVGVDIVHYGDVFRI